MPVTIKSSQIKVKGTDGYIGVDALADSTTASRVAAINSAGASALEDIQSEGQSNVSAIEQKGAEVLESIPDEYTQLEEDVSELKSALSSYLIFSKAEMQNGAKTTPQNTNPVSVSDNKFKCCDFVYSSELTKNVYLYLENNTDYNMLALVIARDSSGVQIGGTTWFIVNNQDEILSKVSAYLENAKIISVTIAFTSTQGAGGIVTGIDAIDYNLFALQYKVADVDYIKNNYITSNAEIVSPEMQGTFTMPGSVWFTYNNLLKAGETYTFVANTKQRTAKASFAVVNANTNEVLSIYQDVNSVIITPEVDSIVLFSNVYFLVGSDFRRVLHTDQNVTVGTVIVFSQSQNTNITFDLYQYTKLTAEYIYSCISGSGFSDVVIVGKGVGVDYSTINDAINNTHDGDTILVLPGIYNEKVNMWGKNRHLIGVSKESVFIVSENRYYGNEPLCANIGSVENITLIAGYGLEPIEGETQSGNYALHIEYANSQPYELVVRNCNLISNVFFAIGAGVRYNQTVKIIDCYIETKQRRAYSSYYTEFFNCGGLFFHNDASGSNLGTDGRIEITNCELKGVVSAVAIQSQNNGNTLTCRFAKNVLWSSENGKSNALTIRTPATEGHIAGSDIILDNISFGNNIDMLND